MTHACPECGSPLPASPRVAVPQLDAFDGVFACESCGLLSLMPQPSAADLDSFYEGQGNWELVSDDLARTIARRRRQRIEAIVGGSGAVFEVGASRGVFLDELRSAGWDVSGIEPGAADVEVARERFGIELERGYLRPGHSFARQFDAIVAWDVLEHCLRPDELLRSMFDAASPGGVVVVAVPHVDGLAARAFGPRWRYWMSPHHVHFFRLKWFERQAAANGAEVAFVDGFAKVQSVVEGVLPDRAKSWLYRLMPERVHFTPEESPALPAADAGAAANIGKTLSRAARRAVLAANQTPVPLPAADLIEVGMRRL